MDNQQQENRRKADQRFMHSLNELETVLQSKPNTKVDQKQSPPAHQAKSHTQTEEAQPVDLGQLLDDAVQDIENFMSEFGPDEEPS